MTKSPLKKRRLAAGMTQMQVAEAMGISQPNYQRWEAGNAPIPDSKMKKLARVLQTSIDELLGKPAAFDLFGLDENIADARTYFGEVAIHFEKGNPLLLPISEEMRSVLHNQFQGNSTFITAESLDNRIVFIRRDAVTDIYFSSEACDDYGPEDYSDHMGILPDNDFWKIVEYFDVPEYLDGEFEENIIEDIHKKIYLSNEDLKKLIEQGQIATDESEQIKIKANERTDRFINRATKMFWQLSSGKLRSEDAGEDKLLYEIFSFLEDGDISDPEEIIYMPLERYHRTIIIRKSTIDYISIPKHKFYEGAIELAEEELDSSK